MNLDEIIRWLAQVELITKPRDEKPNPTRRRGKTEKDRRSGAFARNQDNKYERALWSQGLRSDFPYDRSNGKKRRTCYTGRGRKQIHVHYVTAVR